MEFPVNRSDEDIRIALAVVGAVIPYFTKVGSGTRAFEDGGLLRLLTGGNARGSSLAALAFDFLRIPWGWPTAVEAVANILAQLFELGRPHTVLFVHQA
jgi:hypothetical protein